MQSEATYLWNIVVCGDDSLYQEFGDLIVRVTQEILQNMLCMLSQKRGRPLRLVRHLGEAHGGEFV